jgi:hypothetical protein
MWILIRIVFIGASVALRWAALFRPLGGEIRPLPGSSGGSYQRGESRNKGRVISTQLMVDSHIPVHFRFEPETTIDRLLKAMGLATEIQTGDASFDQRIYVVCDHPFLQSAIQLHPEIRESVLALAEMGFSTVIGNGRQLRAQASGRKAETPEAADQVALHLARLEKALAQAGSLSVLGLLQDRHFARVLVIEAIAFALVGYSLSGLVDLVAMQTSTTLDYWQIVDQGVRWGAIGMMAFLLLGFFLLRGSSRPRMLLIEGAVIGFVLIPTSAILLTADVNRELDRSPAQVVEAQVQNTFTRTRRKKHRIETRYCVTLAAIDGWTEAPVTLVVEHQHFGRAQRQGTLELTLRKGRLGIPWIEKMN